MKDIVIDSKVLKFEDRVRQGIKSLINRGIITEQYITAFNDYLDSTNYNFRVSLVANLIILAKAIELQRRTMLDLHASPPVRSGVLKLLRKRYTFDLVRRCQVDGTN